MMELEYSDFASKLDDLYYALVMAYTFENEEEYTQIHADARTLFNSQPKFSKKYLEQTNLWEFND